MKRTVLIVDDAYFMRNLIKNGLQLGQYVVVGEAKDGREAVQFYEELQPEIVTMDLMMPILNGVEATKAILEKFPKANIIVVTGTEDQSMMDKALQAGAKAVIKKPFEPEELWAAIADITGNKPNPTADYKAEVMEVEAKTVEEKVEFLPLKEEKPLKEKPPTLDKAQAPKKDMPKDPAPKETPKPPAEKAVKPAPPASPAPVKEPAPVKTEAAPVKPESGQAPMAAPKAEKPAPKADPLPKPAPPMPPTLAVTLPKLPEQRMQAPIPNPPRPNPPRAGRPNPAPKAPPRPAQPRQQATPSRPQLPPRPADAQKRALPNRMEAQRPALPGKNVPTGRPMPPSRAQMTGQTPPKQLPPRQYELSQPRRDFKEDIRPPKQMYVERKREMPVMRMSEPMFEDQMEKSSEGKENKFVKFMESILNFFKKKD